MLEVTGSVAVAVFGPGRKLLRTLLGGVTEVSGTLSVASELENDGILRALNGGTLSQFNVVASPAESGGVFEAQGTGVLSLSNVLMGRGVERHGLGHDPFCGRNQSRGARGGLRGWDHRRRTVAPSTSTMTARRARCGWRARARAVVMGR